MEESISRAMLVVDDERNFLNSIRFILGHIGIDKVDTCEDSRCALNMFKSREFAAVLLDITMPHISGMALLEQFMEVSPETPIIMITAVNDMLKNLLKN